MFVERLSFARVHLNQNLVLRNQRVCQLVFFIATSRLSILIISIRLFLLILDIARRAAMPPPAAAIEVEAITDKEGFAVPDPLSPPLKVDEIRGRRENVNKSQWGVAAASTSRQFKIRLGLENKPKAKEWDRKHDLG